MRTLFRRALIFQILIFALATAQLAAQPAPDARHDQKIKTRAAYALDHHRLVTVDTADRRQLQGLVTEAETDHFVLALQGQSTTLAYAEVDRISWQKHMPRPLVAAIVGVAVAGTMYAIVVLTLSKNG
jgi:hypothetical protein